MNTPQSKLFFYSLIFVAAALPLSAAAISLGGGLALVAALVEFFRARSKAVTVPQISYLFPTFIFGLQLLSFLCTSNHAAGVYDLKKALPFLLIPLAFFLAPPISERQRQLLLQIFSVAVVVSAMGAMLQFYRADNRSILDAQFAGFIHHIRFSLMVLLAIASLLLSAFNLKNKRSLALGLHVSAILFLLLFLVWHQSLTGISTLIILVFAICFYFGFKLKRPRIRLGLLALVLVGVFAPALFVGKVAYDFYNTDKVEAAALPQFTANGNPYINDLSNQFTENGHYIGLYLSEVELGEAWNKRSTLDYDSTTPEGYRVSDTIIRYLTSKNLTKDAEGVAALTGQDIRWIEEGISNYKLAGNGFSLYPRLYVTIWEMDHYLKTGNSENKSVAQRFEYLKAGWTIWMEHFWFGVGVGNWKEAYADAYREMGSSMRPEQYADAHNQYLSWLARLGLLGTAFILCCLVYPVVRLKSWKTTLAGIFFAIILVSNFGDSNLDTHSGGYFFVFFYCLFLVPSHSKKSTSSKVA